MRLYGVDGHEIAFGYLGVDLADREKAFDCLAERRDLPYVQCFEWMQKARLYLSHEERPEGLNCYTVEWFSLSDKYDPVDCYEDGEQYGHWLVECNGRGLYRERGLSPRISRYLHYIIIRIYNNITSIMRLLYTVQ